MPRTLYRIHPAIGIARLGNSDESFIGPEVPGVAPLGSGPYKDQQGRILRQAARFRVFSYTFGDDGSLLSTNEVQAEKVEWTVQLCNRKADAPMFSVGIDPADLPLRNADVEDRATLVIDSGPVVARGPGSATETLGGQFLGTAVALGEMRVDDAGHLVVIGGKGNSFSVADNPRLRHPINNDTWCDDTCDGPVRARLLFPDGTEVEASAAWVVVAPPDYSPQMHHLTTLWDIAEQTAKLFNTTASSEPAPRVSFTRDVLPILERTVKLQWTSSLVRGVHGRGSTVNFLEPVMLARLADNSGAVRADRERIFASLRSPDPNSATGGNMPRLEEGVNPFGAEPRSSQATLTPIQYEKMRLWQQGDFLSDWGDEPAPLSRLEDAPAALRGELLDRAALEACVGPPFAPGIEVSAIIGRQEIYNEPFRISPDLIAGSLTAHLALPWQADFWDCSQQYWPSQRPGSVSRDGQSFSVWLDQDVGVGNTDTPEPGDDLTIEAMIEKWPLLGFVVIDGDHMVERERAPSVTP